MAFILRWRHIVHHLAYAALLCNVSHADVPVETNATKYNGGFVNPNQTYFTEPDITSPVFLVNTMNTSIMDSSPYLFLALGYGGVFSPYIFNATDLSLVYADPSYRFVNDVRAQTLHGERTFTFWEGGPLEQGGHASGHCVVQDHEYDVKYNVTAQGLGTTLADLHEVKLTRNGTILFNVYQKIPFDLSPVAGPLDGELNDSLFQEIDLESGELLFTWRASDHFSLSDSNVVYEGVAFDFFHINSVDKTDEGNYLISSRHTNTISYISGKDGSLIWVLGGKKNNFHGPNDGTAIDFSWQHDARFLDTERIHLTMFDNRGSHHDINCVDNCSRGLHLKLNYTAMTAEVVEEYYHPGANLSSGALCGYTTLPSGNVLLAWGTNPCITEHTSDGAIALDIQVSALGREGSHFLYRAYKSDWESTPPWDPRIAVRQGKGCGESVSVSVYVSWNGATEVKEWSIITSDRSDVLERSGRAVARTHRQGFETFVSISKNKLSKYIAAVALDGRGKVLGRTAAARAY